MAEPTSIGRTWEQLFWKHMFGGKFTELYHAWLGLHPKKDTWKRETIPDPIDHITQKQDAEAVITTKEMGEEYTTSHADKYNTTHLKYIYNEITPNCFRTVRLVTLLYQTKRF